LRRQYYENDKRLADAQTRDRLTQLQFEKEIGLRTVQSYLDEKFALEKDTYQKELAAAQKLQAEQQAVLDYVNAQPNTITDRLAQIEAEQKLAQAIGNVAIAQQKLNNMPLDQSRDQTKAALEYIATLEKLKADLQSMQADNAALAASQVGVDLSSGEISNPYARETAMMEARYQREFELIDKKAQRLIELWHTTETGSFKEEAVNKQIAEHEK
jgi:hypothetical protein